jgi:hypothetical protein
VVETAFGRASGVPKEQEEPGKFTLLRWLVSHSPMTLSGSFEWPYDIEGSVKKPGGTHSMMAGRVSSCTILSRSQAI